MTEDSVQEAAEPTETRRAGWQVVVGGLVQAFGGVALVGGLCWILLNLHGPQPVVDLSVGAVLAFGGLVLLMPHRLPLSRLAGLSALVAGLGGTAAGLARSTVQECCMWGYAEQRGFPFAWVSRGDSADSPALARELGRAAPWRYDFTAVIADVVVWGFAGLLLFVVIRAIRDLRR